MAASNLSSEIAYSGHHFAMMSSAASLTPAGGLSEQFGGITQAAFLKRQTEEDVAMVAKKLGSIAAHVFDCSQMRLCTYSDQILHLGASRLLQLS